MKDIARPTGARGTRALTRRTFVQRSALFASALSALGVAACVPGQNTPATTGVPPASAPPAAAPSAAPSAARTSTAPSSAAPGTPAASVRTGNQSLSLFYLNFPQLDPQIVTNGMWFANIALLEGLVTLNKDDSGVDPATAEKWDVSADKLIYTFSIRQGAKWSNGNPVTAQDFEWTYKRLLTPRGGGAGVTLGANSFQATIGIKGATDFFSGKLTDWSQVGVRALDAQRLQITLAAPNPDFLIQMAHPSMLPLHPATLEQFPQDWQKPERWVGNGPYLPKEWVVNTSMTLVPNPAYWDQAGVPLSQVNVRLTDTSFAPGAAAVAYENNEVDLVGLAPEDIARYKADPRLNNQLQSVAGGSIVYLAVLRSQNPVMEDVRVREALSLGLDRKTVAQVTPNLQPGVALVPSSVPNFDPAVGTTFDVARAKALLAEAGFPDGKGFPELRILAGGKSPVQEAIADLWQKNLGIKVALDVVEAGVYVERRWAVQSADYVGFYFGSFGQLPTWAAWTALLWGPEFTKQFSLKAGDWAAYQQIQGDQSLSATDKATKLTEFLNAHASPAALAFEKTVQQALAETDAQKQQQLFKEAAKQRQATYLFLPVLYQDSYFAVKPTVKGLQLHHGGLAYYLKGVSNAK